MCFTLLRAGRGEFILHQLLSPFIHILLAAVIASLLVVNSLRGRGIVVATSMAIQLGQITEQVLGQVSKPTSSIINLLDDLLNGFGQVINELVVFYNYIIRINVSRVFK